MTYKILSVEASDETVTTTVCYTLADGKTITVDIPHFSPASDADVIEGIQNREVTEQRRADATVNASKVAESLKASLSK